MDSKSLDILEKIFEIEINNAVNHDNMLFQSKSKLMKKLEEDGYIQKVSFTYHNGLPVLIEGYVLTEYGRYTYCNSKRIRNVNFDDIVDACGKEE